MVPPVSSTLLSFVPRSLKATRVLPTAESVTIEAVPRPPFADCPTCRVPSRRVHSSYRRMLHDLPWQGRPVVIHVSARRFHCLNHLCARRTFAERLSGVTHCSVRRTGRLRDLQRHLGLALGGEAGARLAIRISAPTSPDTLLRLASAHRPADVMPTPRVLGIDDLAWRRGRRYGTVLVDLETNQVVDLLPDREAASVAAWLRDRPGVEIVARDRAGAYADGVRQGTPDAVQVADRWHLLRNLGEAVQALGNRHAAAARRAAQHVRSHLAAASVPAVADMGLPIPIPTAAQLASAASKEHRQARYEEAARLYDVGATITRISAELGADRKTVRKWLLLGHAPLWQQPSGDSILDPFKPLLGRRWSEGCRNASLLWREILTLGFRGGSSVVRDWAAGHRGVVVDEDIPAGRSLPPVWPVPSGYRLARLLTAARSRMDAQERMFVSHLLAAEPALNVAVAWAKRLNRLLRRRATESLDEVLAAATGTLFARFAASLRRDFDAISAGLVLPWTTSPVEGQVSRIKMLKRTMYGRAGFELLRARVMQAA
ncbi:MAG: ISL3 family transposase [Janthinobacterium lividum]